jgi:hypothetical protein
MTGPRADQLREHQQRQTDELTVAIRNLLRDHAAKETYPMMGAAVGALAQNLGESIAQVPQGKARKSLRDQSVKLVRHAERTSPQFSKVKTVEVTSKH